MQANELLDWIADLISHGLSNKEIQDCLAHPDAVVKFGHLVTMADLIGAIRCRMENQLDTTPDSLGLDSPITLQVDDWANSLKCPRCGGTLKATVFERYYGCMMSYAPGGAYLCEQADIDAWENDDAWNDLIAITCGECDFRIDNPDDVEFEIVPPLDGAEG